MEEEIKAAAIALLMCAGCGDAFTMFPAESGGAGGGGGGGGGAGMARGGGDPATGGSTATGGGVTAGGGGDGGDLPGERQDGEECADPSQCLSGVCADGVCCDRACDAGCESCRGEDTCGSDGVCALVVAGTDPANECTSGSCYAGSCAAGTVAFVTSSTHDGALGGVSGADAICQDHANAECLPGTYFAWLSTETTSPSARFVQQSNPYRLVDGTKLADDYADLTDGSIAAMFDVDERGQTGPISETFCGPTTLVHTGTLADGTAHVSHCDNWTSTAAESVWGVRGSVAPVWTFGCESTGGERCSTKAPIYCFQQ